MSRTDKLLARMRANPQDWRLEDLVTVARQFGVKVRNPRGSHVVFTHESTDAVAVVPAHKPVNPVYVRQFLIFLDSIKEKE